MRDYDELVKALRENAEWAEGNIWEVPIMLPDNLKQAADAIEELQKRVGQQKGKSMKIYISNASDRDEVVVILARNGYTVRQGSEKVEGQKVRKSFVKYSERSAKE